MATNRAVWIGRSVKALPATVPPKKVQNGILNEPQHMPHRSNAKLGHADMAHTPTKPFRWMKATIHLYENA